MPEAEQPSFMVASLTPLMVSQATGPRLAQSGPAEPTAPSEGVLEEYDPWEPFNEKMFTFNYNMDKYVLKPIAKAYNFVMPDRLQQMIDSGFDNLLVVPRVVNNLLQWRPKGAGAELGRFLINSTFGIGGLFDIAKQEFGLQKTRVDFGQTLGIWGVSPGPFLVLPFLPPPAIDAYVRQRFATGAGLPIRELTAALQRRTEGNPLFPDVRPRLRRGAGNPGAPRWPVGAHHPLGGSGHALPAAHTDGRRHHDAHDPRPRCCNPILGSAHRVRARGDSHREFCDDTR